MNSRFLTAFLCLCTLSTGCIYVDNGGGGASSGGGSGSSGGSGGGTTTTPPTQTRSGDITFLWTFSSQGAGRCADVPGVKKIRITIPGETLLNGGIYACNTEGVDGIVLHDFAAGTYKYTLEALDYSDKVLYQTAGSVTVNGDTTVKADLSPGGSGGGNSFTYASWTFESTTASANPTCTQSNVTNVDVRIDGGAWKRFACEDGYGSKQVSLPSLSAGSHTLDMVGLNVTSTASTVAFYKSVTVSTTSGSPVSNTFTLNAVGGLALRWQLVSDSLIKSCADAGVANVSINLTDSTGAFIYGDAGRNQACTDVGFSDAYLKPGNYTVYVRGFDSTGKTVLYTNENNNPPTLKVTAAQQPAAKDGTIIVLQKKK